MTKAKDDKIIGLRQKQLCEHLGWRYRDIAHQAKALGLSTHAYVQQKNEMETD